MPRPTQANFNPEEDEPFLDPEYEHIGTRANQFWKKIIKVRVICARGKPPQKALVYEIFIFFIESTSFHPNQMKKHIDQTFIIQVTLFKDLENN